MVRAAAAVLQERAAELREGHQQHAVQELILLQVADQGGDRLGQLVQQGRVIVALAGMVVEPARFVAAQFGVEDANPQVGPNQLGHDPEHLRPNRDVG